MVIDTLYINEAIRIRKEYINSLTFIKNKEVLIKTIISKMESVKEEITATEDVDEELYKSKLVQLSELIDKISTEILPYHDKITNLDKDQQKLYLSIKDRYPNIKDDEIQSQIVPHIIELDKKLKSML